MYSPCFPFVLHYPRENPQAFGALDEEHFIRCHQAPSDQQDSSENGYKMYSPDEFNITGKRKHDGLDDSNVSGYQSCKAYTN
jgi:hypothetical protein